MTIYDDIVLRDGPKLYLPLDDASGATAVALAGANGTYVGSPTLAVAGPDAVGSDAAQFDGSTQYVDGPFVLNPAATPHTVELWLKHDDPASLSGGFPDVAIQQEDSSGSGRTWAGIIDDGTAARRLYSALGGVVHYSTANVAGRGGQWIHFVVTYDGTSKTYYVDGVFDSTRTQAAETCAGGLLIASGKAPPSTPWDGSLAAIAVYDYVLTAAQIAQHAAAGPPAFRGFAEAQAEAMGAVLHLPLDDVGGTVAFAGVGANGTYVGGPTKRAAGPSDVIPHAVDFDGVDDHVLVAGEGADRPVFSIEAWANLDAGGSIRTVVGKNDTAPGNSSWALFHDGTVAAFNLYNTTGGVYLSTTGAMSAASWHHMVGTFDVATTTARLYVDGTLMGTASVPTGTRMTNSVAPTVGLFRTTSPLYRWDGKIAAVTYYDRVLTAAEVAERYMLGLDLRAAHVNSPVRY